MKSLTWPLPIRPINRDQDLVSGVNRITLQPPGGCHWLILNLAFAFAAPAVATFALYAQYLPATPEGEDRLLESVNVAIIKSDTKIYFPIFGGSWLETTGPILLAGSPQRFYLAFPHKLVLVTENAPAGRAAQIRGLVIQTPSDVSLEGLF